MTNRKGSISVVHHPYVYINEIRDDKKKVTTVCHILTDAEDSWEGVPDTDRPKDVPKITGK